ncbi:MAG: hypothetical protein P8O83_00530 [Flavobacteriaceae bacterium]|nr:hypothetical protein [Flavobacteriaceae bacterium]
MRGKMDALENRYLYHLYSDLISNDVTKDLRAYLGGGAYSNSDEYARDCIQTAYLSKSLYGLRIRGWTASALSCFDNFILTYIHNDLNEPIKSFPRISDERHKYHHLIEKGGEDRDIGTCFDTIYQQRNEMFHVEVVKDNGERKQRRINSKKLKMMKEIILDNFEKSLKLIEKKIP